MEIGVRFPIFLSTLSLRRATTWTVHPWISPDDFYPRSPCGERPIGKYSQYAVTGISIHALLAESDCAKKSSGAAVFTISIHALLAESDSVTTSFQGGFAISIHALLAESDAPRRGTGACHRDFYPRSPCGERRLGHGNWCKVPHISIHALLAESDNMDGTPMDFPR